jgi:hypothetical protein
MLFKKQFLIDELDEVETRTIVEEIAQPRRWMTLMRRVFEYQGKLYQTFYEVGNTEYQDTPPYEFDPEEIECQEVFAEEKVITVYVTKE